MSTLASFRCPAVVLGFAMVLGLGLGSSLPARAADVEATLTLKDHRFQPAELKVPSGQRLKLTVVNEDKTPEEFESKPLKLEKVVPGQGRITLVVGPLKPGRYKFVGEYHEDSTQGVLVVE